MWTKRSVAVTGSAILTTMVMVSGGSAALAGEPISPPRLTLEATAPAAEPPTSPPLPWEAYTDSMARMLKKTGTKISLNGDLTDQQIVAGPTSSHNRGVARYDLGINQTLWQGAFVDMDVRGGDGNGVDVDVPNFANTNQYAQTGTCAFVLHLYLAQKLFEDQLTVRVGKLDVGDWIDANRFGFYNFLGYSFAHNTTIPLPGNTLGGMFTYEPNFAKWFYVSGAASNALQNPRESGLNSSFDSSAEYFTIWEVGLKPKIYGQDGVYRFEGWYDPRNLPNLDGSGIESNRCGFAISFDQNITEKFGIFARYGLARQDAMPSEHYWSAGFLWHGPIPGREKDDFAIGVLSNCFSSQFKSVTPSAADSETYIEAYYQYQATKWMQLVPTLQVVTNPGGTSRSTEVVLALHVALRF